MNIKHGLFAALASVAILAAGRSYSQQSIADPRPEGGVAEQSEPPETAQGPVEPQTRGPIHEAFAQPLEPGGEPGMVVPKQPPAPVPEQPPDEQPEGKDVQWIPGYWAWDADKSDYLWISGVYRDVPPGRQYVPGYWTQAGDGWRWVSGFWAGAQQDSVPTVPQPPESLEGGPTAPAPDDNSAYIPGTWMYRETRYVWRPGYWTAFRPGVVWIPARYYWTPAGYVFVDGYWDLPLESRGVLFAPVCFTGTPWSDPSWCYRPSYCVSPAVLFDCAFYRPGCGHLYFGNYFGPGSLTLGFRPWFNGIGRYDPAFSHHVWQNRNTPNWFNGYQNRYHARHNGTLAAPPRTFAKQTPGNRTVVPVNHYAKHTPGVNFVRTPADRVQVHQANVQRTQQIVQARRQLDTTIAKGGSSTAVTSLKLPAVVATNRAPTAASQIHHGPATSAVRQAPPVVTTPYKAVVPPVVHAPSHAAAGTAAPQNLATPPLNKVQTPPVINNAPKVHTPPTAAPQRLSAPPPVINTPPNTALKKMSAAPPVIDAPRMKAPPITMPQKVQSAPPVMNHIARAAAPAITMPQKVQSAPPPVHRSQVAPAMHTVKSAPAAMHMPKAPAPVHRPAPVAQRAPVQHAAPAMHRAPVARAAAPVHRAPVASKARRR